MALGLNQIAFIGGSLIGLVAGGFLAVMHWRLVFLVSVPVGIAGTIWAYLNYRKPVSSTGNRGSTSSAIPLSAPA